MRGLAQQGTNTRLVGRNRPLHLLEDVFANLFVKPQETPGGKPPEPLRHELGQFARRVAQERSQASIESELKMLAPGQVEHDQFGFARRATEATSELLKEYRGTLGRTEEEQCVDVRDVHPFVVDVHYTQHLHATGVQIGASASPLVARRVTRQHLGQVAVVGEATGNLLGVANIYAECD